MAFGLALALFAGRAAAQEATDGGVDAGDGAELVMLVVGQSVDFTPGISPTFANCDDLTIIRVGEAGSQLRLTGLKPGSTLCSFGSLASPGRPRLYRFTVVP
jgi:hypothetical protein